MAKKLPGLERTPLGFRAWVWVPWPGYPDGRMRSKRFSRTETYEPTVTEALKWRADRRLEAKRKAGEKPALVGEGFLADADRYLEAVQAMPQYGQRRRHIQLWAALFGEQESTTVQSSEIRAQRDRWLTVGPRRVRVKHVKPAAWTEIASPLSASEVNLRLRALENLWTVLWPGTPNPVREVPECDTPPPQPRGQTFALALEILAFMPDITSPKKGAVAEDGSLSRIRFEAMLLTGLTPKQLGTLKPSDVDASVPCVTPPMRLKGRLALRRQRPRKAPKARPVMACALPVLARLFELGGNKPFSRQSLNRSVRRAIVHANAARAASGQPLIDRTLRVYDLTRHTFGTEAYRAYGDLKVVQELMGHSDITQTEIYAHAAVKERAVAAVAALDKVATRGRRPGGVSGGVRLPVPAQTVRTARTVLRRKAQ